MNSELLKRTQLIFHAKYKSVRTILFAPSKLDIDIKIGEEISMYKYRPIHVHYNLASLFSTKSRIGEDLVSSPTLTGLPN